MASALGSDVSAADSKFGRLNDRAELLSAIGHRWSCWVCHTFDNRLLKKISHWWTLLKQSGHSEYLSCNKRNALRWMCKKWKVHMVKLRNNWGRFD